MRKTLLHYRINNNTDNKHVCLVHLPFLIPPNISSPSGLPVQIDMICHKYIGPNRRVCLGGVFGLHPFLLLGFKTFHVLLMNSNSLFGSIHKWAPSPSLKASA